MADKNRFATDIAALRKRAREHLERDAVTPNYGLDVDIAVALLNTALATEIVCILRYKYHAIAATGIDSKSAAGEFAEHAEDEEKHAEWIAERINQLGGNPNFNPADVTARAATEYVEGGNLIDMIRENLVAERIAIEHYRDLIRFFADKDPTTRHMLERVLADEEEHANDMHDLLVSHEGKPMLKK
jgi:bacterioferritin